MDITIMEGIIVGGVGGAMAGLAVWGINLVMEKIRECREKTRIVFV